MKKAEQVAEYLLSLSDPDIGDIVSHLKLHKLLYYAQGFHLAMYNKKLFKEMIFAWKHGPVVADLWHKYKQYGQGAIPKPKDVDFNIFSKNEKELLFDVYSVFGQYSAWRLKDMTYEEPPWKNTSINEIISEKKLLKYFSTLLEDDE